MRGPGCVGAGVLEAHPDGAVGRVVGRFRHGSYVRTDAGVYAVAGPAIPPGPLHLVLTAPPAVREGDRVRRDGTLLRGPGWTLDLAKIRPYAPWLPAPSDRAEPTRIAGAFAGIPDRLPPELSGCWPRARVALDDGDLVAAAWELAGRGPGLTPVGDDVLAGLLLMRAWLGAADEVSASALASVAERTTDLSNGFLRWAAQGLSIGPVHDLGRAAAGSDAAAAVTAADRVRSIGASSGAALLFGLATAARLAAQSVGAESRSSRRQRIGEPAG